MRVYIDTSVIGGCLDEEFKEWSLRLFSEFASGKKIAVISDLTRGELQTAPEAVKAILDKIPLLGYEAILLGEGPVRLRMPICVTELPTQAFW